MIKTIITMIVTAIAGLVGYLVSDSFRERLAQKQRDKIASEVARGDEAAVNARLGRFRSVVPWVVITPPFNRLGYNSHSAVHFVLKSKNTIFWHLFHKNMTTKDIVFTCAKATYSSKWCNTMKWLTRVYA